MYIKRIILLILISALLISCARLGPYRTVADLPSEIDGKLPAQPEFNVEKSRECRNFKCIQFVEYDQFGSLFSRAQQHAALAAAQEVADNRGTIFVYVHGWHHSARVGDSDISGFHTLIDRASGTRPAVGIYVGWRGDSIKAETPVIGKLSYLLTFWGRKSTAHKVGNGGGVSELFRKLSYIRASNPSSRLVVVGHSFGGAVVYSAVSQLLIDQIHDDADLSWRAAQPRLYEPVADLVVLVNPAFEAMRLHPLYALARSVEYQPDRPPRLVVITTVADVATRTFFPAGRHLGTLAQSYSNGQSRGLNTTAIGHYIPYVTHQLIDDKDCNDSADNSLSVLEALNSPTSRCYQGDGGETQTVRLTRCHAPNRCNEVAGGHYLAQGKASEGFMPKRFPIANIRTTGSVMNGHVDIWNPTMARFLSNLLDSTVETPTSFPMPIE